MNDKEKELKRIEIEKLYHVPGCANYMHRKRNCIFFGFESTKHVIAKCIMAYQISKFSDAKFTPELVKLLNEISNEIDKINKEFEKVSGEFVCEVVPNTEPNRRVDVLCLDTGQRYEVETNHKKKKDEGSSGTTTIYT